MSRLSGFDRQVLESRFTPSHFESMQPGWLPPASGDEQGLGNDEHDCTDPPGLDAGDHCHDGGWLHGVLAAWPGHARLHHLG